MKTPLTILFTGLSSAGKSTLAVHAVEYLREKSAVCQLLDGDVSRDYLGGMFGFTAEERLKVAKIYSFASSLLSRNGVCVVIAALAPLQSIRDVIRTGASKYLEVYVKCDIDICVSRDLKGIYKKSLAGEMPNVAGINDDFEEPTDSDLVLDTGKLSVEECVIKIRELIDKYTD